MDVLNRLVTIVGPANLLTEDSDLESYVTEERGLYRGQALAVARPADTGQVAAVVTACAQAGIAMVPQGGNTGLCGGGVPNQGAVVISTERQVNHETPHGTSVIVADALPSAPADST